MQERDTDDLQQKLLEASDLDRFMEENNDSFASEDMAELLLKMLQKKKMTKSMLARGANISEIYLHQVFAGQRRLSRQPPAVRVFWFGRHAGGDTGAAWALWVRPALCPQPAGCRGDVRADP